MSVYRYERKGGEHLEVGSVFGRLFMARSARLNSVVTATSSPTATSLGLYAFLARSEVAEIQALHPNRGHLPQPSRQLTKGPIEAEQRDECIVERV